MITSCNLDLQILTLYLFSNLIRHTYIQYVNIDIDIFLSLESTRERDVGVFMHRDRGGGTADAKVTVSIFRAHFPIIIL